MSEGPREKKNSGGNKSDQKGGRPPRGAPLTPTEQRRRAAEERISKWTAKTELGRKVVSGEITTVEEALASGLPLREPPIV